MGLGYRRRILQGLVFLFFGPLIINAWGARGLWPALPLVPPVPASNPQTPEKILLGQKLFFDARLSKDGSISCNSCHSVMAGGTDNRAGSVGIKGQKGGRSSPTVFNAAFNRMQFWDGRAPSLEEQAKGPLINPIEMGMESHDAVIQRLKKIPGYVAEFQTAFPGDNSLNIDNLAKAIAAYERTLVTPNSAYDRYANGNLQALSPRAERGLQTAASVGCLNCHDGAAFNGGGGFETFPTYRDNEYVAKYHLVDDKGKGALTGNPKDDHRWKIPTWRNVALTAPYFHNGSVKTLPEAVRVMAKTQLDMTLTDEQVGDIVEFMGALSGDFAAQTMPVLPSTPGETVIEE